MEIFVRAKAVRVMKMLRCMRCICGIRYRRMMTAFGWKRQETNVIFLTFGEYLFFNKLCEV